VRETMNDTLKNLNNPDKIAEEGERVYKERHRERLEKEFPGQFAAIDVGTGEAYVGEFPEVALKHAQEASPHAVVHLIRIGAEGAFKVSYAGARPRSTWWNRPLRQTR
jgi:hypothetical protein